MGSDPVGRRVYNRPGEIVVWVNKRLQVLRDGNTLYIPFRGPNFMDHRIIINQQTGAADAPADMPKNQGVIITVQVGNGTPVENRIR